MSICWCFIYPFPSVDLSFRLSVISCYIVPFPCRFIELSFDMYFVDHSCRTVRLFLHLYVVSFVLLVLYVVPSLC